MLSTSLDPLNLMSNQNNGEFSDDNSSFNKTAEVKKSDFRHLARNLMLYRNAYFENNLCQRGRMIKNHFVDGKIRKGITQSMPTIQIIGHTPKSVSGRITPKYYKLVLPLKIVIDEKLLHNYQWLNDMGFGHSAMSESSVTRVIRDILVLIGGLDLYYGTVDFEGAKGGGTLGTRFNVAFEVSDIVIYDNNDIYHQSNTSEAENYGNIYRKSIQSSDCINVKTKPAPAYVKLEERFCSPMYYLDYYVHHKRNRQYFSNGSTSNKAYLKLDKHLHHKNITEWATLLFTYTEFESTENVEYFSFINVTSGDKIGLLNFKSATFEDARLPSNYQSTKNVKTSDDASYFINDNEAKQIPIHGRVLHSNLLFGLVKVVSRFLMDFPSRHIERFCYKSARNVSNSGQKSPMDAANYDYGNDDEDVETEPEGYANLRARKKPSKLSRTQATKRAKVVKMVKGLDELFLKARRGSESIVIAQNGPSAENINTVNKKTMGLLDCVKQAIAANIKTLLNL